MVSVTATFNNQNELLGRTEDFVPAGVGPVAVGRGNPGLPHPYVRADLAATGPDEGHEVWKTI